MEFTDRITDVWKDINDLDQWQDPLFDWHKARVASVFAKLAYLHIPEYELRNVDRANIIPCREYRERVMQRSYPDVEQILRDSDLSDFFIVEKPYAIAIVVRVRKLLFISMRGTQRLYDWASTSRPSSPGLARSRVATSISIKVFIVPQPVACMKSRPKS